MNVITCCTGKKSDSRSKSQQADEPNTCCMYVVCILIFGGKSYFHPSPLVEQATPCETETKSDVNYRNKKLSLSDSLGYSIQYNTVRSYMIMKMKIIWCFALTRAPTSNRNNLITSTWEGREHAVFQPQVVKHAPSFFTRWLESCAVWSQKTSARPQLLVSDCFQSGVLN